MSLPNEVISGLLSSAKDEDVYQVSRSLRFNSADSAYLSRTSGTGNQQKFTWSFWIKISSSADMEPIGTKSISAGYPNMVIRFESNVIRVWEYTGSSYNINLYTTQVLRDYSAWYHIVLAVDTTQATITNRVKLYLNGTQVTSFSTATYPAQYTNLTWGASGNTNVIGGRGACYMSEIYVIDGQQLDPTSFAQSDANGRWVPKAYTGTYGTQGFYLNFSDNSGTTSTTLGKDSSGNGNNWTPNNFSVTDGVGNDSLVDTPTNYGTDTGLGGEVRGNYATLNALWEKNGNLSDGNLYASVSGSNYGSISSIEMISGKWYAEFIVNSSNGPYAMVGVAYGTYPSSAYAGGGTGVSYYAFNGNKYIDGVASGFGNTYAAGNIISVAVDADNKRVWFAKNGVWQASGNPTTGSNPAATLTAGIKFAFQVGNGGDSTTWYANFGQRPFAYTAPSGFKCLCTQNLPTPSIKNPSQYMNIVTYTGTGATRSITGVGFTPDLTWIKNRNSTQSHKWTDSVRGTSNSLISNTTGDEVSESGVTSFDTDGFTIGSVTSGYNTLNNTYVGWNWKKGVTPGFDIVTYTGNGANRTISHGLGAVPHFMIVKARTTASTDQGWAMYHRNLTSAAYYKRLDGDPPGSQTLDATVWNSTAPTSTVFSVGTSALTNTNNDTYVAYLFTEIIGFSRFGSYVGNASSNGPFVWCGFRPKYILCMYTGSAAYAIFDSVRETYNALVYALASNQAAEPAAGGRGSVDFLSNGFKLRNSDGAVNAGSTYTFAAFAESPFKYSRAR